MKPLASVIIPSWVVSQSLASPDSLYTWNFGVTRTMTRRARTLRDRMVARGIPATLERDNRYAPGLWHLRFPVSRYEACTRISDACAIGDLVSRKHGRKVVAK